MEKFKTRNILKLAVSIVICQLAGFIGSLFTRSSVSTWYTTLNKASFNPPNWAFSPVWITLFVLMAISLFFVWRKAPQDPRTKSAISVFGLQLILNTLWSALFFGLKSPLAGLIDIILLWAAILLTIRRFYQISRVAGALLIPYILWVSFAVVLNASIFLLNP